MNRESTTESFLYGNIQFYKSCVINLFKFNDSRTAHKILKAIHFLFAPFLIIIPPVLAGGLFVFLQFVEILNLICSSRFFFPIKLLFNAFLYPISYLLYIDFLILTYLLIVPDHFSNCIPSTIQEQSQKVLNSDFFTLPLEIDQETKQENSFSKNPSNKKNTAILNVKLDLKLRYRFLICLIVLFPVSILNVYVTPIVGDSLGSIVAGIFVVIIHIPFFIFLNRCTPSWRAKHAPGISFQDLYQSLITSPQKLLSHYVKVRGKVSYISERKNAIRIVDESSNSSDNHIFVYLHRISDRTFVVENGNSLAQSLDPIPRPISIGDAVEIRGKLLFATDNNKKTMFIDARSLYHYTKSNITIDKDNENNNSNASQKNAHDIPLKKLLSDTISNYKAKYTNENPDEAQKVSVTYIFSNAHKIAKSLSSKDIQAKISASHICIEQIALNILQNCAMNQIKPCSAQDFIKCHDDSAYKLYNAIIDEKRKKGFITDLQYQENARLATKLKIGSFF